VLSFEKYLAEGKLSSLSLLRGEYKSSVNLYFSFEFNFHLSPQYKGFVSQLRFLQLLIEGIGSLVS